MTVPDTSSKVERWLPPRLKQMKEVRPFSRDGHHRDQQPIGRAKALLDPKL